MESEIWGLQSRISPYPSFPPPSQHPLSSVPHLQDAGTAGYPSHFPNSCLLTLSPSCAFARTVDFLYKTDEEEKKYFALFLLRFIMLCVCLRACLPRSRGKLLGESQIDPWPVILSNLDTSLSHRQRGALELLTWEAMYMIKFVFYPDDYGKKI